MITIVWTVDLSAGESLATFLAELDAIDFCRTVNVGRPTGLHQVCRRHRVGGRVV